jgi:hypothetical protein
MQNISEFKMEMEVMQPNPFVFHNFGHAHTSVLVLMTTSTKINNRA